MSLNSSSSRLATAVRRHDLCSCLTSLSISSTRSLSSTTRKYATPTLHPTTRQDKSATPGSAASKALDARVSIAEPSYKNLTPAERAAQTAERARAKLQAQVAAQAGNRQLGQLADNSLFADDRPYGQTSEQRESKDTFGDLRLAERSYPQMELAINPRPNARARWQRKMLIRHIQHRGRLPRVMQIERTERSHLSKSHFFKTSMKKLAPLARQIAGKSIDEAILQMRFSKKKAAIGVRKHLIQARDEAIVIRGMGLDKQSPEETGSALDTPTTESPIITDPGMTPPLAHQTPTKTIRAGFEKSETDIYVAQAWTNRGPYGAEPEFRARGRVNILRPPWTGISVLLKEEKTRTREKSDKEEKSIRKRVGKNMWTQLPDRPITKQSQYVLW